MKNLKLSVDFCDAPELIELLRRETALSNKTQKQIVIEALEIYFSHRLGSSSLYQLADTTFAEWNSKKDSVYDKL